MTLAPLNKERLDAIVVGVGHLGRHHARILNEMPEARLVAVVDSDAERAKQVAEPLGVKSYSRLGSVKDPYDFAVVSVPTTAHADVACKLLKNGAHVFVEKPIADNLRAAQRIVKTAEERDRIVQVGHVERFNPAVFEGGDLITDPRFIEIHRLSPFPNRATDVSVVLDLMIHDLDLLLLWLKDRKLERIDAVGTSLLTEHLDIVNARLRFEGNLVANITSSRISTDAMRKVRVFQPDSYLSLDSAKSAYEYCKAIHTPVRSMADIQVTRKTCEGDEPLKRELRHFIHSLQQGKHPEPSGRVGLQALELALKIQKLATPKS